MAPPEYPAEHAQFLAFELGRAVGFGRVFVAVVAVQAQGAVGVLAEAVDAYTAVVQQGVDLSFDHVGQAAIDGQGGAARQQWAHVGRGHAQAQCLARVDAQAVEGADRQAQVAVGDRC